MKKSQATVRSRSVIRPARAAFATGLSTQAAVPSGSRSYFDALSDSDHRGRLPGSMLYARDFIASLSRLQLAAVSLYLYDNVGFVSYVVDQTAFWSAPVWPMSNSDDPGWNDDMDMLFLEWARSKYCDYTGRFNLLNMQRLMSKGTDIVGDMGYEMVANEDGGLPQLNLISGWRIGDPFTSISDAGFIDGVKVDKGGRVLGYQVYDGSKSVLQSSNSTALLYDPENWDRYRGITPIRRGSNDIRDQTEVKGLEKIMVKIRSSMGAVLESNGGLEEDTWGDDTGPDGTGPKAGATQAAKKMSVADLLGGDIPVLSPGQTLKFLQSNNPTSNIMDFISMLGAHYILGMGVPSAFFLDDRLTGPNQRSVNSKAQRKFETRSESLGEAMTWVRNRWAAAAIQLKLIKAVRNWDRVNIQNPPKLSIDAGREMAQEREDVISGLMTRREHFGNRGMGWQRETDQTFREDLYIIQKAKEIAAQTGVSVESLLEKRGYGVVKKQDQKQNQDNGNSKQSAS